MANKKFIQKSIKHKGRVRNYILQHYGGEGFDSRGNIKMEYLEKAKEKALRQGNHSLVSAIDEAITLKRRPWER